MASQALRRSDLRSLDAAVQSRVGDGFLVAQRPIEGEDGTSATFMRLPVFPNTKFAVIVRGRSPLWMMIAPFKDGAPGLTRKHLRCWQQIHTRTTIRAFLDGERRLKNLFQ